MGDWFTKAEEPRGVRFEKLTGDKGSVFVQVNTFGQPAPTSAQPVSTSAPPAPPAPPVFGRDIKIGENATWYLGNMADETVQRLPRASDLRTQETSSTTDPDQSGEHNEAADRHRAVGLLEYRPSNTTGFERQF